MQPEKVNQPLTSGIAKKGFSGMRRFVARINFSSNLTGNRPQSHTGHTVIRCASCLALVKTLINYKKSALTK